MIVSHVHVKAMEEAPLICLINLALQLLSPPDCTGTMLDKTVLYPIIKGGIPQFRGANDPQYMLESSGGGDASSDEGDAEIGYEVSSDEQSDDGSIESYYDSDDVLTDKSDFIDDSEDLGDVNSFDDSYNLDSDASYEPYDSDDPYLSNTPDDSETSSIWSDNFSTTHSLQDKPSKLCFASADS